VVAPCNLVEQYLEEPAGLSALKVEAAGSSETSVRIGQITSRHLPEDSTLAGEGKLRLWYLHT
jgi:hypothetical protein